MKGKKKGLSWAKVRVLTWGHSPSPPTRGCPMWQCREIFLIDTFGRMYY